MCQLPYNHPLGFVPLSAGRVPGAISPMACLWQAQGVSRPSGLPQSYHFLYPFNSCPFNPPTLGGTVVSPRPALSLPKGLGVGGRIGGRVVGIVRSMAR